MSKSWEKLPRVEGHIYCGTCGGGAHNDLDMERIIAVGFGSAGFSCDGEQLWDENNGWTHGYGLFEIPQEDGPQVLDVEELAKADPDHDWRIFYYGPLSESEYQRQGDGDWVLIGAGQGFA